MSDNKLLEEILKSLLLQRVMSSQMQKDRALNYKQMAVFASSPAFVFPEMIPKCNLYSEESEEKAVRRYFSESEDNAMDEPIKDDVTSELNKSDHSDITKMSEQAAQQSDSDPLTMTHEQLRLIRNQVTKHVQLLAQTFVQAAANPLLEHICTDSKMLLQEMQMLAHKSCVGYEQSFFNPVNLEPALGVTQLSYMSDNKLLEEILKSLLLQRVLSSRKGSCVELQADGSVCVKSSVCLS
jgi:hypothetical protein